ncbi:MAG: helix-turn-helix domain-containing protein [Firmicutes bacterium]|nr:helix-turn-helix domain-containing protein [Bacillota bacterium]
MIALSYRQVLGSRIRTFREARGWSQVELAGRIPLSQKQLSRLELGDVSLIDRELLIRIAEILEEPLATGELNQWLHAFGYRPHVVPLLPLPPDWPALFDHVAPYPAMIVDFGRYMRKANPSLEALHRVSLESLTGVRRNWLWHYFHPDGMLYHVYPRDSRPRVLNRLFWDWFPYYSEPWNQRLREDLEAAVGVLWTDLQNRYHIPTEPLAQPMSETVTVRHPEGGLLVFQTHVASVAQRPDLFAVIYDPVNDEAMRWCRQDACRPKGA